MRLCRGVLACGAVAVMALAACGDSEGVNGSSSGSDTGTEAGAGSGMGTGMGAGTGSSSGMGSGAATGSATGTPLGACDAGNTLTPEQRFRDTCTLLVNYPTWGACPMDPTVPDATMTCETNQICETCDYLWYMATYSTNANCLTELSDLRCCAIAEMAPLACNADGHSIFEDISAVQACATPLMAFQQCS